METSLFHTPFLRVEAIYKQRGIQARNVSYNAF